MPTTLTLTVDANSESLSFSLIPGVQAAYDAGPGYPPFTVDQEYVLTNAVRVGLYYWLPPKFWNFLVYVRGEPGTLPTLAKLTPAVHGFTSYAIAVPDLDVAYADEIIAGIGGSTRENVLGCALCTGLAMLAGSLVQVGPWLP